MSRNLTPYQWQFGDIIVNPARGPGPYRMMGVSVPSYNVNSQDYQVPLSDETHMGQDTLQAQPITFTLGVIDNGPINNMPTSLPDDLVLKSSTLLTALQTFWKANATRKQWGQIIPLIFCDGYGSVRQIYGRPGKFQYTRKSPNSQFHKVQAEFRRADTNSYSDIEYFAPLTEGASPVSYTREGGDADAWLRVLLEGPQTNPQVVIGDLEISLGLSGQDFVIPSGVAVEVNSYPWSRRIIDTTGVNWRTALIGNTKYLDQLLIPANTPTPMSWTATGTGANSGCQVLWRDAYNVI